MAEDYEVKKTGPTIAESGDQKLIDRVSSHLGPDVVKNYTKDETAAYVDGGDYGGTPDPRSRAAYKQIGQETAKGGSGPKKKP